MPSQNWYSMSDPAIVTELCHSLRQIRLQQNFTQEQLADKAGLSRSAISEMENGKTAVSLITIVQVLRALEQLQVLNVWKSSAVESPLQVAKFTAKGRLRASGKGIRNNTTKEKSKW